MLEAIPRAASTLFLGTGTGTGIGAAPHATARPDPSCKG